MNIGQVYTSYKSDKDILVDSASDLFAIKKVVIPNLTVDLEPGSVVLADGSALVAGNAAAGTKFFICLDYVKAGSNVTFRAVDRHVVINPDNLVIAGSNKDSVIALIINDGNIRISTQRHILIPTT